MSIDGRIGLKNGKSKWITNEKSRSLVHSFRSEFDAIIIGGNTLRKDDPLLTTRGSKNPEVLRLLGVDAGYGAMLGLSDDWAANILTQVGNYSESFEKHIGPNTPINIQRGLNALYKDGGILYAPPFR